ncbi:MAG: hypothetical protein NWR72_04115 [Bacteroidia bacterium]|nr:hypothetical protein [Bacteroidia bacterium]
MKALSRILPVFVFVALSACSSSDLTLLNEVKRFEPEWTRLSSTVTTIKSNLKLTDQYDDHLKEIDPYLSDLSTSSRSDLADMRSRYRNMMTERDSLSLRFGRELTRFEEEVTGFNNWVNDLMQEKVDQSTARTTFDQYQRKYTATKEVMDQLYGRLAGNIELHNSLMRKMASAVNLYGNYEITVR